MSPYDRYDAYSGRLLADRYRLPRTPSEEFELAASVAFDTVVGQEVSLRQVPLPDVVDAEVLDGDGATRHPQHQLSPDRATREPEDPTVRRAVEAAMAASRLPDHPRLDQVFDVFVQGDGLWIVSELVAARPLAALLAEERLKPYRAAEVAADLLAALRIVHAHGWTHRNLTADTVMICEDGRAVLTGLAAGAAEEALCGYDPLPPDGDATATASGRGAAPGAWGHGGGAPHDGPPQGDGTAGGGAASLGAASQAAPGLPAPTFPTQQLPPGVPVSDVPEMSVGADVPGLPGPAGGGPGVPLGPDGYGATPAGPDDGAHYNGGAGAGGGYADDPLAPRSWREAHRRSLMGESDEDAQPQPGPGGQQPSPPPALPEAYRRWDTGAVPRVGDGGPPSGGAAGLVARLREQGGHPDHPDQAGPGPGPGAGHRDGGDPRLPEQRAANALPTSWDFEQGSGQPTGATGPAVGGQHRRPAIAPARPTEDRAARSDAIAAYRAGAQAAAQARRGDGAAGPAGPPGSVEHGGWDTGATPRQGGGERRELHTMPHFPAPDPAPDAAPDAAPDPAAPPPDRYRGPDSALAAERARRDRMIMVRAVTERWAPEQAGPVYEHWRLAPPVGPPADFWALGALLFRAVQGYPAYPEESVAELTQAVCAEQPAFAEECGALRPIVESLLRQDPTERPSAEELRGWLRSLLRSAPEPEIGRHTVTAPPPALEPGRPSDPRRLPIVRHRGTMVGPLRRRQRARAARRPRRLGGWLLAWLLLGMAAAVATVVVFSSSDGGDAGGSGGTDIEAVDPRQPAEGDSGAQGGQAPGPDPDSEAGPDPDPGEDSTSGAAGGAEPSGGGGQDPAIPPGYKERQDPAGFSLLVPEGFTRHAPNDRGQVIYSDGPVEIVVVPGRDSTADFGSDVRKYQLQLQPELDAYRADQYNVSRDVYVNELGDSVWVEGVFTWRADDGERRVAFNQAVVIDDHYHVVMVRGPADREDHMAEIYDTTPMSYEVTG